MRCGLILLAVWMALSGPVLAVQPDEILSDPALETRARDISRGLRCLVCRNENIDDSNADLARDLRILVRERLVAGDSDAEVVDFIVARYGEYVLLMPTAGGANWVLWGAGPGMLLIGLGIGVLFIRRRGRPGDEPAGLTEEEDARLQEILRD
ncbi:cytochrome c-type biogenesis protein CcmH [Pseudooceanicola sediminis]|uniref:Cytochrome c-type biogenesis protein n=1 Tax=Pseudooceanicola sediminis TaxID=2211117 RepID=A0A399J5E9_9RHOB|nr:cytochrome c-type biogenesis protein [Pseudooceanicola sediminis]KAA2317501.1 cytochrome c-type biogenesis protein CcmH [Puniceibacterium sp. HSS470]RII39807.1 cytochrome c-type biogenesis protein CcmH [Pseudooceanicola sediminis]|tara:strand:- start:17925 stop:18383 length:459 start_codon:yes stop_codon:yes gene_type:complete